MWSDPLYKNAFGLALLFHIIILFGMMMDDTPTTHAASVVDTPSIDLDLTHSSPPSEKIVSAVSVDKEELQQAVSHLKQQKEQQYQQEVARKKALDKEVEDAKARRIAEEKRLKQLEAKSKAEALALKKRQQEETRRLQEVSRKKLEEEKRLAEMKKKQEQVKQEQLKQEQMLAQAKLKQMEQDKQAREKLAREEAARKSALAAKQAKILSAAEKYKVLIVNAISREWILPENSDKSLSSQFQIRLGPDGSVLDVHLARSSGDPILDRSAQTAIYKASPLPVPDDPELFDLFRDIRLTVRPENIRG